jgi:hypothetical protein
MDELILAHYTSSSSTIRAHVHYGLIDMIGHAWILKGDVACFNIFLKVP